MLIDLIEIDLLIKTGKWKENVGTFRITSNLS